MRSVPRSREQDVFAQIHKAPMSLTTSIIFYLVDINLKKIPMYFSKNVTLRKVLEFSGDGELPWERYSVCSMEHTLIE